MRRAVGLWICVAVMGVGAREDRTSSKRLPMDILSVLNSLRPGQEVVRDVKLAAPELFMDLENRLKKWGYPLEEHTVYTEDGYILTVHRIPHGRRVHEKDINKPDDPEDRTRPPVILQHGLLTCSEYWALAGPDISPALRLVDSGYDVWMTNSRGNLFSKHKRMSRRNPQFWKFSLHELGAIDIPAAIDYILNVTKQEKLFHVGHSMGNTLFFIAMSTHPEYNEKIRLQISLSPAVFFDDFKSVPLQIAVDNMDYLQVVIKSLRNYGIQLVQDYAIAVNYFLCREEAFFSKFCAVLLSTIVGPIDFNNTTQLSLILARSGSSSSLLLPWHYAQILRAGKFVQFDFGAAENIRRYGSPDPPEYPLIKVTAPVAIYAAEEDYLVSIKAAKHLASVLPNVVSVKTIHEKFFNHFDFVYHKHLNELVTNHIINMMARF